jgi:hypothetical protein
LGFPANRVEKRGVALAVDDDDRTVVALDQLLDQRGDPQGRFSGSRPW